MRYAFQPLALEAQHACSCGFTVTKRGAAQHEVGALHKAALEETALIARGLVPIALGWNVSAGDALRRAGIECAIGAYVYQRPGARRLCNVEQFWVPPAVAAVLSVYGKPINSLDSGRTKTRAVTPYVACALACARSPLVAEAFQAAAKMDAARQFVEQFKEVQQTPSQGEVP